ncbi:MAG: glycosyltransferase, partial [Acidimicrobiaceae bacterium]
VQVTAMSEKPIVSVVIPTFNHALLLKRALNSVVAQTYSNWEAIVINNFSTDETIDVVNSFKDDRIKLVNFKNNGIIAASRNQGIKLAQGKFVAFLDSDDNWYPKKLEKCVDHAMLGATFVCHGEMWINSDLSTRAVMYGPVSRADYQSLLFRGNCISTSTTFIETELLRSVNGFDESTEIVTAEDYDLWIRLAATKPKTVFIPEILGEFHRLSNSASSAVLRNLSSEKAVLRKHFAEQSASVLTRLRQRHRFAIADYGAARQLTNQPIQALKLFASSIRLSPFVFKIYPSVPILILNWIIRRKKL